MDSRSSTADHGRPLQFADTRFCHIGFHRLPDSRLKMHTSTSDQKAQHIRWTDKTPNPLSGSIRLSDLLLKISDSARQFLTALVAAAL